MSQKPSTSIFLNCVSGVIYVTAKVASLFFQSVGAQIRNPTWFLVTAQTTNMAPDCSRTMDTTRPSEAAWTTDINMVSEVAVQATPVNMAPSGSMIHRYQQDLRLQHKTWTGCSTDHRYPHDPQWLHRSQISTETKTSGGLWLQTWPLVAAWI